MHCGIYRGPRARSFVLRWLRNCPAFRKSHRARRLDDAHGDALRFSFSNGGTWCHWRVRVARAGCRPPAPALRSERSVRSRLEKRSINKTRFHLPSFAQ